MYIKKTIKQSNLLTSAPDDLSNAVTYKKTMLQIVPLLLLSAEIILSTNFHPVTLVFGEFGQLFV